MRQIKESNINRIMSHMKDKDIAMLTAFRTDPELRLSKTQNRKRNKILEDRLNSMGYRGFTKIVGYYNETPENKDSVAIAEESYVILNTGSSFEDFVTDIILLSKDTEDKTLDQQSVIVWSHEDKKAYLFDNQGNILQTFNNFNIDLLSQNWSDIKGHNLVFTEESVDIRFGFTDRFNSGGNWMNAMGYDASKNKFRKQVKESTESNQVDSAGNPLSKEQVEYFKDSKMRDSSGKLLLFHHGTDKTNITAFKTDTPSSFFSSNYNYAYEYSLKGEKEGRVYDVYLNITKPFDLSTQEQLDFINDKYIPWAKAKGIKVPDKVEIGKQVSFSQLADGLFLFLKQSNSGYDGIIVNEEIDYAIKKGRFTPDANTAYLPLYSNQIKAITNKTPTSKDDISEKVKTEFMI